VKQRPATTGATRSATRTASCALRPANSRASGSAGARVDRIAERAGANKRMLYYYYGNKEALFLAVLESRYEHIRRAEHGLRLGDLEPVEGMRRLIAFTWNYYLKHPEFLTLLNSENLHQARHLRRSRRSRRCIRRSWRC
jgi:AcrR family transcriptional regulator